MAFLGRCSTASSPASLLSLQPQFQVLPPLPHWLFPSALSFLSFIPQYLLHWSIVPLHQPLTHCYILTNPSLPCLSLPPWTERLVKRDLAISQTPSSPQWFQCNKSTTYKYRPRGPPLTCSCFEICPPVGFKCLPFATQITAFVCSLLFLCPETSLPAKQDLRPSSHLSYQTSYACITCTIYPGHVGKFSNHYEIRSLIHPYLDHWHA